MGKTKRIISVLCAGIVTISMIFPPVFTGSSRQIFAASKEQKTDTQLIADENGVTMHGTNAFGVLMADALSEKQEVQENNKGCNIFEVTMEGTDAYVSFETMQDAAIVVGIYTESGEKMLASGMTEVFQGEKETYIEIEMEEMPEYFLLRAFMVDKETLAPLCASYESP